jgi:predicted RNA-binding Zn-ribbon protein involved in translation (DUF1610 family)
MLQRYFDRERNCPKAGEKVTVRCAGCRRPIEVDANRLDQFRAMCPPCGEKFLNGELDTLTFYSIEEK